MYWNDPKLYSANFPAHYFMPHGEAFNYNAFLPWQQFSRFTPYENFLPPHFSYPQFNYPRFDFPANQPPFMTYGYMDRPQFPFYKPFIW